MNPLVLLVARPTPSGTNERGLAALAAAVAQRVPGPVRVAHLDQDEPTVHDVLDEALADGTPAVTVVPLALPPDAYLTNWIGRAVANWRETRAGAERVEIGLAPPLATTDPLADAVAALADAPTTAITASPAGFRSPAWSVLEIPDRHLLVCRGPRCTVYGAGADLPRGRRRGEGHRHAGEPRRLSRPVQPRAAGDRQPVRGVAPVRHARGGRSPRASVGPDVRARR